MASSINILQEGSINTSYYHQTGTAKTIQKELATNKETWMDKKTSPIFKYFSNLDGLLKAIEKKDPIEIQKIYYRAQHYHTLDEKMTPFDIPVFLMPNLDPRWKKHVLNALRCINEAAPGLYMRIIEDKSNAKIIVGEEEESARDSAFTRLCDSQPFIHLGSEWPVYGMAGTSIHELLHALGFKHEMQRSDSYLYVDIDKKPFPMHEQYRREYTALTRFDPFSIMMYPEDDYMKRRALDRVWKLKRSKEQCQTLSELNKVALNLLYTPCFRTARYEIFDKQLLELPTITDYSPEYFPRVSEQTQMLYCGRKNMKTHNQNSEGTTDGFCGPNNWANCPACRVVKEVIYSKSKVATKLVKLDKILDQGKWQGLSGLVYCGKRYSNVFYNKQNGETLENDGVCGCNNGIPCTECGQELSQGYVWTEFNPFYSIEEPAVENEACTIV